MRPGISGEVALRLSIAGGYHINANPPSYTYLKPTPLKVDSASDITVGAPIYPEGERRKFNFAEQPLAVYEGDETTIKLPVSVSKDAAAGPRALPAKLQVQACDLQACYPPQTVNTSISLMIK